MKKQIFTTALLLIVISFQFCNTSKKAQTVSNAKPIVSITFEKDIAPLIQNSCSPCHISGKGKKEPLDNYTAATEYIDDIIRRLKKDPAEPGFMPMRHAKLSDSTIQLFVQWKANNLILK